MIAFILNAVSGFEFFGGDSIPEIPPFVPLGLDFKAGSARSFETTLRINVAKKFILFEQHCAVSTIVNNHIKRKETFFMLSVKTIMQRGIPQPKKEDFWIDFRDVTRFTP
jgi:hypothetical protein